MGSLGSIRSIGCRPRRSRRLVVPLALALLAGVGAAGVTTTSGPARAATPGYPVTQTSLKIPTRDGITLDATVALPAVAAPARRWPLVVIPGTFAGNGVSVDGPAKELAARGFVTISYLERGFGSTGKINGGGPKDVADVSDAITWGLAHEPVDAGRVGLVGLSYGGGIVLEAAAFDPRVKAVAEIAGWADMGHSLFPNNTRALLTTQALYGLSAFNADTETHAAFQAAILGKDEATPLRYAAARSVTTYAAQLAKNRPALFMSHGMNETVFQIDQSVAFWRSYPGPKRLELRPGDHGGNEFTTGLGIVGESWTNLFSWVETTLGGTRTALSGQPPIYVIPRSPTGAHPAEHYAALQGPKTSRLYLSSAPAAFGSTRTALATAAGEGSKKLKRGENWIVRVSLPMWTYAQETVIGPPPSVPLTFVDQSVAGLWKGTSLASPLKLRGETKVHLTLTPSARTGTVVVHLLDVSGGTGYLVAHQPYTWKSATPGKPMTVDLTLPYNAYDLPAGHQVGLVVATSDPSFAGKNPPGSTMTIDPSSWIDLPRL